MAPVFYEFDVNNLMSPYTPAALLNNALGLFHEIQYGVCGGGLLIVMPRGSGPSKLRGLVLTPKHSPREVKYRTATSRDWNHRKIPPQGSIIALRETWPFPFVRYLWKPSAYAWGIKALKFWFNFKLQTPNKIWNSSGIIFLTPKTLSNK